MLVTKRGPDYGHRPGATNRDGDTASLDRRVYTEDIGSNTQDRENHPTRWTKREPRSRRTSGPMGRSSRRGQRERLLKETLWGWFHHQHAWFLLVPLPVAQALRRWCGLRWTVPLCHHRHLPPPPPPNIPWPCDAPSLFRETHPSTCESHSQPLRLAVVADERRTRDAAVEPR